ncbi:MAG: NADH-quinone oxidoreductase subunit M [Nitrosopumilus sp.]|nr:NADH-quinone oxidoreductase subunit M [Nitrosopumilus sp.]CAI9830966.1 Proton-translocating NADH-quinone oxidoreductase, chain M [Nitrosopumilaceae archaeon]MDA7942080.1 NADH-quinone oxidoreductase subunit M [Nitrosopumilus sp.]MDA7943816.1 NADH-quinone oxidoreductase subunit M [Nitrosopumilus sp.]MDA7945006.1 NADH-quinone oxidoreductase subunit M [Nitrosopumilus sp.]
MTEFALLQAVFIPLLLSPAAYLVGRRYGTGAAMWVAFGTLLYSTALVVAAAAQGGAEERYPWTSHFGEFGMLLDGLASPFAIMIYVLCTILALYSRPYMVHKFREQFAEERGITVSHGGHSGLEGQEGLDEYVRAKSGLYYALYMVFSMGMLGTVLATNLIEFYVFFEFMLVPGFFLVALWGDGPRRRIGLMFLFWTHAGAVVLLLGFLMIGLTAGGFDFEAVRAADIPPDIALVSAVAIAVGLGVKLAVFMFHVWLPYVHGSAPTPISALLSPAMIGIGAYGIFRLIVELLPGAFADMAIWLHVWGIATMIYGGAMALMQDDVKRLLAYSSISQMGYLLFGIGSGSVLGMAGAEMMYVTHALGKGLLFMTAGILIVRAGTRSLTRLGGLAGKMPVTAVCAVIGALTIAGVPPTSGFMGEWLLFYGALETALEEGSTLRAVTFGLGLLATALTMSYMLWMLKRIFFGKTPEHLSHARDPGWHMKAPMMVLAGFTVVLGIYPDIFLAGIVPYMGGVLGA